MAFRRLSFDPRSGLPASAIPAEALEVISALEQAGFEAWIVGGFLRDALLGLDPSDVDIASSALWTQAQDVFHNRGWRTHETGTAHGTLTVVVGDRAFEVTTFRSDGAYDDARHPSSVTFVSSIDEDLSRRDFTMNALAYHPDRGFFDPFGGLEDIESGVIRAVGDPESRFREDALRIVRACRFVGQLGFDIDARTYRGMCASKGRLCLVSRERVLHELRLLLISPFAGKAIMETVDALSPVLPELVAMKGFDQHSPYHSYDVLEHTARVVDGVPRSEPLRWAALFHDSGKPATCYIDGNGRGHFRGHPAISAQIAKGAMDRLGMSKALESQVLQLVLHHDDRIEPTKPSVKRAVAKLGGDVDLARALFELKRSDALAHAPTHTERAELADKLQSLLDEIVEEGEAFSLRDLSIDGNDVMRLGVPKGPLVGQALDAALDAVIDGRTPNDKEALTSFVDDWFRRRSREEKR